MTPAPDYTSWSNADLIDRVSKLESQLRTLTSEHVHPSAGPPKKKPKKSPKPFDPSKYSTRLIALKFAYLGSNYNGFEHHSNNTTPLPTIEEELWKGLRKTKLIFPQHKVGQSEDEVCWDGCEYSKCGRTDRGVSAFGQVIALRLRSARPIDRRKDNASQNSDEITNDTTAQADGSANAGSDSTTQDVAALDGEAEPPIPAFDPIKDELPYIQLLNRVLPPDIRVLAWCPNPPEDFSARFSCKERRYRYFFTNPAYMPAPGADAGNSWLDISAMEQAAKKYEGLHDFRNLCKVDASKQITSFERRIFHAGIHTVGPEDQPGASSVPQVSRNGFSSSGVSAGPKLYYFEVRGSAFLWHQVRHLVAVLFLVGQGYEQPGIVDELLDARHCPSKPSYEMADDTPLVLWDCIFPDHRQLENADHGPNDATNGESAGYMDCLNWIHVGDSMGGQDLGKRNTTRIEDGKFGRGGVMEDIWSLWRKRKIDEVLAGSLLNVVAAQGSSDPQVPIEEASVGKAAFSRSVIGEERSARIFDGSDTPRAVGKYVPLMQRERTEPPEVVNARYAARKGLAGRKSEVDADE